MPCGYCTETGHNVRTCPNLNEPIVDRTVVSQIDDDDDDTVEYINDIESFSSSVKLGMSDLLEDPPIVNCMVCFEDVDGEKVSLKCGHDYCVTCFVKHMRIANNCAYCRDEVCEPVVKASKSISSNQISDIIENSIVDHPDFINTIHNDLINQTKNFIEQNYADTTTRQRAHIAVMCKQAIQSTNMTFGYWIAGIHMADSIVSHFNDDDDN
jgi:hypothetical protein